MRDYVTLSLFYATDISFICLMTCVDNKQLKHCKISVVRLLEQCEDAYWSNYNVSIYGYIKIPGQGPGKVWKGLMLSENWKYQANV